VVDSDEPLGRTVDHHDMIDPDRFDDASVDLAVGGCEDDMLGAILGVKESVSQGAASAGGSAGRCLFCVEGVVEAVAERAPESDQIRMPHRIHIRPPVFRPIELSLTTRYHEPKGAIKTPARGLFRASLRDFAKHDRLVRSIGRISSTGGSLSPLMHCVGSCRP
jgi:hypothetical protein